MPISVAIVEDNPNFLATFEAVARSSPELTLVGCAASFQTGLALIDQHQADVFLVDLNLPDGSGIDLIRHIKQRHASAQVMVVTVFGDLAHVLPALQAGAVGYLLKDSLPSDMVAQIGVIARGGSPISPAVARAVLSHFGAFETPTPPLVSDAVNSLTKKEAEVLRLAARGYTYKEVARHMNLSNFTVHTYVKRAFEKLQVNSKTRAIEAARSGGLAI